MRGEFFKCEANRFGFVHAGLAQFFGGPHLATRREDLPEFGMRNGELYSDYEGFRI